MSYKKTSDLTDDELDAAIAEEEAKEWQGTGRRLSNLREENLGGLERNYRKQKSRRHDLKRC